jgi:hypothetical protein
MGGLHVHDRYKPTFEMMEEDLAVVNWKVFNELNLDGYAKDLPGVFLLAHTSAHDENRLAPPYFAGKAADLKAALSAQLKPADPELAKHERRGERWFKALYVNADKLDEEYQQQLDKWGAALVCNSDRRAGSAAAH